MKIFWKVDKGIQPTNDDYEKASKLASEKDYLCLASAMSQVLTDRNVLIMLMIGIVLVNCHYLS